jgi:hypothetical protein
MSAMLTAEAHVETARASRYLVQLCRHAGQMNRYLRHRPRTHEGGGAPPKVRNVEWTDTRGTVSLDLGQVTLRATADKLTLRAEAADEEKLRRIQDLITARLEQIGRRDSLTVNWQNPHTSPEQPGASTTTGHSAKRRGRLRVVSLVAVGLLVVAAHFGLGGTALAKSWLTGGAAIVVLGVVFVKVVALVYFAVRRHRSGKPGRHFSRSS